MAETAIEGEEEEIEGEGAEGTAERGAKEAIEGKGVRGGSGETEMAEAREERGVRGAVTEVMALARRRSMWIRTLAKLRPTKLKLKPNSSLTNSVKLL